MSGGFEYQDERDPTRHLSREECWERLSTAVIGRLATTAGGEVDIFPVNHGVAGRAIYFRTAPGSKLLEILVHAAVAFEVDGYDDVEAWSVVAKGEAAEITGESDIAEAESSGARPWAPEEKDRWVRIRPSELHGRVFERPRD
ncbi:pyridoxamine 5'-phosphate oxidase family protein [Agromyces sp. MMS24-K17]|uniref:pyridoxamine 5'-phosphate oxidase family protein n=1 Tax=Agromyces sp. MMS24-K17 TaxID=3372850 RepID=UPI0037545C8C